MSVTKPFLSPVLLLLAGMTGFASGCGANAVSEPAAAATQPGGSTAPAPASAGIGALGTGSIAGAPRPTSAEMTAAPAAGSSAPASTSKAGTSASAGTPATSAQAGTAATSAGTPAAGTSATPPTTNAGSAAGAAATTPLTAGTSAQAGSAAPSGACTGSLCESFEAMTGPMLDASWEVGASNCTGTGMVSIDSTQAHSGMRSVRVMGAGGFCNHVFFKPKTAMLPMGAPLFLRFFVRFEKALTQSHVTFLAMRDEHEMKDLRMGGQSEILMWNRESDDATLPELSPTGIGMSVKPEINKWLCVEVSIDPTTSSLQTWVDGKPVVGLTVEGDATPDVDAQWKRKMDWKPDLRDVRFGWESYGSDVNTLWFDDVALGATRLGCGS